MKKLTVFFAFIIGLLCVVPSAYFYSRYRKIQNQLINPTGYAQEEAFLLREKVSKLMELPSEEQPTIATVTDTAKLSSQPFFANAVKGDKVLIFTQAKKAILYRESTNKIIEVAPVNIGQNTTPIPSPTISPTPRAKKEK